MQCIEYPSKHNPYKQNYRILPGSYDDLGWDRTEYGYIYSIRLNRAKYIAQFDQEIGRPHTDTEPNKETRINWRWENDAWHLIDGPDGVTADIKVKCAETPVKPEKPTALDGSFAIVCKNNEATHAYKADYIATPSQYTISDVQMDNQGYYVTATVTVAPNLVAYNTATRVEHRLVNEQDATLTITFRYDTEATGDGNRKWQQQGDLPVVEVICKPKAPTADELKKLEMAVQVKCVVDASQQHTAAYGLLGECDVDYFVFEPRQEGDDWLCDISYYPERYVAEFNTTFQNLKHVQNDEKIVPVTLIWDGDSWQLKTQGRVPVTEVYTVTYTDGVENEEVFADQVYSDLRKDSTTPAFNGTPTRTGYTFAGWEPEVAETVTQTVIYVAMWTPVEPKAPTAEELEKLEMAVQVKCVVDDSQQHTEAYGLLGEYDEDYFVGEPRKDGDGWLCDISYYPERYVAAFNTTFQNLKHVQNDEKIVPVTLIWDGDSWQLKTQGRVPVTEVYTVTYTDGVENEEVFADQVYSDLRKDSTTPAFNGTPTRTGYTFAGWEPEVAATVTQTVTYVAKWEKKTYKVVAKLYVNGKPAYYQNEDFYTYKVSGLYGENIDFDTIKAEAVEQAKQIKKASASYTAVILEDHEPNPVCTTFGEHQPGQATHYVKVNVKTEENVVIFQSFEGKTDLTKLHTTTAPYGTNVVEFLNGLGLDLDVAGYTLDTAEDGNTNWYKKDSPKWTFGANDTINGWTNVLLKYTVTPHNIYAYARLNSYFAPLTTSEFDTPVTLNEATLSRLGLGSYNSLGYISIGSFTFDAMPLTSDLYFGDDAELSAVAEKLATDIALETGVSDKIAEKIAWTALYKTVNEEDMEPGYPAEASYQLSGNLNLASVTFRAGAENVENMPAVNYTYDDGAIDFYDFYFAGDTITLPTTEPTREGYSFKGWSVEVIPAENDADHLDADGADDAADETLLKAGDTYTITAGGVIFTAQWEKKTFTVKYYLPDETGAWVEKKMDTVDSVDYATYSLWTPNAEDGYEFSGWYQKPADIGVKAKVEKLYMAKEWKLYGKFTPIEYTIQYVYNDGKATSTNPTTYTVESDTITLADATGADWGKTFLEWHDENGQKITEIPTGSTGDRVITAYWNWPVHLHYLDKDNNEIESATLYVSELEPGACVLPTGEKTGYDFDGWYEAKKDIGTASHKLNALSIAKKWELYGRYTAKTDVSYTVKYLREGDNKVLAPEKVVTDQTFDTEVTEQAADVVGYTPDAPSKTMILDEYNKVLTFSYSANTYDYTVRHIKQLPDGSYDEANAEVETLSGKFEALAAVTAKDYGSHYPTNDADTKQNIKIEEGLTIDVKYDLDEHTLTFETNGGSAINPVTVRHGNAVARPADPTKDKYTFIGWYADPEFTEEYDFATVLEADKTIYAKFELTSTPIGDIYVRYDVLHIKQLPDGTYDLANAEVEHLSAKKDTTVTAVAKNYSATHHFFNSKLGTLTGTAIQPYMGVDGKPVYTILSVYYDLDFHTLTFDTMGGSKIAPETVRHGLTVAKPKDPVNGGFLFDGWYTDKTYRTPYNFATPLTQDTTIYAKWFLIVLPGVTVKKNTPKLNTADHFAYVQGYPDGTVKPAGNITRAETAAILFRLMDDASRKTYYSTKSGFRDVASGSWYNTYVATLNNAGVITDSSNGYFRPNEAITRAELAAMLAKFSETTGAANYFNDVSAKYWAANAIAICAKLGWITGYPDGTFRPDKNVTRAELMAMINRATGRAPKSADAFLPGMKTWSDNTADKWYYLDVQEATNSHSYTVKGSETWTALTSDPNWSLYE
ncbi:MAG: InlB B-repeat-containing protein [Oscillospiraceae bacterium]